MSILCPVFAVLLISQIEPAKVAKADDRQEEAMLALSLDKEKYEIGEPIVATLRLTNTGKNAIQVNKSSDESGLMDGFSFQVLNDKGEHVKGFEIWTMHAIGSSWTVNPGKAHERKILVNYRVLILEPGIYSVRGEYKALRITPANGILSPEVKFEIVKTSPAQLDRRIARLEEELNTGADPRTIVPHLFFTGQPRALNILLDMIYSKEDLKRSYAGSSLHYFPKELLKSALMDSLKKRGPRDYIVLELNRNWRESSQEVVPLLVPWLESNDADARMGAVEGLGRFNAQKDPALFPKLAARLKDENSNVRRQAASAVGSYRNAEALEALKGVLGDTNKTVAEQATIAVGWTGAAAAPKSQLKEDARNTLVKMARDPRPDVSRQATYWLSKIDEK